MDEDLAYAIQAVIIAADQTVLGKMFRTRADEVRAAVTAAFECALGNGLIRLVPRDEWPEYMSLTPPYRPPGGAEQGQRS